MTAQSPSTSASASGSMVAYAGQIKFEREGIMRRVGYGDGDWMDAVMMARLRD